MIMWTQDKLRRDTELGSRVKHLNMDAVQDGIAQKLKRAYWKPPKALEA